MKTLHIFILIVGITTNLFTTTLFATINEEGKRTTHSTISLELGGGLYYGLSYNYFLNKNIELEAGLGTVLIASSITAGIKYHFYINKNLTTYISLNGTKAWYTLGKIPTLFSSLVGLRYETDFGLTTHLGVGAICAINQKGGDDFFNDTLKITDIFRVHAGFKIGYAF